MIGMTEEKIKQDTIRLIDHEKPSRITIAIQIDGSMNGLTQTGQIEKKTTEISAYSEK